MPRDAPQRCKIRRHHEVAVAAFPRGDPVAVDGVHLHIDGEQVVAAFRAVRQHVVQEMRRVDPLALQPPLHVGDRDDDGVDLVG